MSEAGWINVRDPWILKEAYHTYMGDPGYHGADGLFGDLR